MKLALLFLLPLVSLADVDLRQGNVKIGPVRSLDCKADGGLYCTRDAGEEIGRVSCVQASATETGCISPSAQTFAGNKTFTGDPRIVGHVHASLTACDASHKGTWQTCTTHNTPVFCNGTSNIESAGVSSAESPVLTLAFNGIPPAFYGAFTLSSTATPTITAVTGFWGAGTGAGSLPLTFVSSAGTCTCSIDCDAPLGRSTCTGNCTIAASDTVFGIRGTSTCTLDPYVGMGLTVVGTLP